jgi:hypothetical protein
VGPFLHVRAAGFVPLPGEDAELVNEGMYGKAVARYLEQALPRLGYEVPGFCCDDWGWWVELAGFPFVFGVCIYAVTLDDGRLDVYVTDGAVGHRRWSWRRFRFEETGAAQAAAKLHADLLTLFRSDPEVEVLATDLDAPFVDAEP